MLFKKINQIPLAPLIILTLFLGFAPFVPEPHLQEKFRLLMQGSLKKPLDIFDLLMHGAPFVLLTLRLITSFIFRKRK